MINAMLWCGSASISLRRIWKSKHVLTYRQVSGLGLGLDLLKKSKGNLNPN
jgi:hypothetical protein